MKKMTAAPRITTISLKRRIAGLKAANTRLKKRLISEKACRRFDAITHGFSLDEGRCGHGMD